ncbi:unnamed protein product [Prorocentrum cordatum]|uniref:Uncharacterized protein n=1 Tax=Prorocentrum cordatum TaxID=2364126 RepID=A0ABN9SK69_9DINO|nr:unnamed protein product [Polarella glacialis]
MTLIWGRRLCKQTRTLFGQMDDRGKVCAVWPVLRAKVEELGLGHGAVRALERWRGDVTSMPQLAGLPMSVRQLNRSHSSALDKTRLSDLCAQPILPDCVAERTERLLAELRIIASVTSKLTRPGAPTAVDHD